MICAPSPKRSEITDAVQGGQSFTVTRDGHRIGKRIPLRRRRRFVPHGEFAAMSRTAPDVSLDAFHADQDATAEQEPDDPYALSTSRDSSTPTLLPISNGCRTADVNDALPTVVSLLPITLPLAVVDPTYDRVPLAVRLLVHLTGPVSLILLARWELRRLRTLHHIRVSDIWYRD